MPCRMHAPIRRYVQYHGFDEGREDVEFAMKVKVTLPEKWLDKPTPASKLKEFFMKAYRKKYPTAPLALLSDDEVELAVKDESMFMFSKKVRAPPRRRCLALRALAASRSQACWRAPPQLHGICVLKFPRGLPLPTLAHARPRSPTRPHRS